MITSGGRVLAVSATASTLEEAVAKAYQGVETMQLNGMHYRKDVAYKYVIWQSIGYKGLCADTPRAFR